jgi:PAS domain S-box-containing protein
MKLMDKPTYQELENKIAILEKQNEILQSQPSAHNDRKTQETELKNSLKKAKESEERLNLVIKGSNDAHWDWDLITDELYYSPQWWKQIGYKPNEIEPNSSLWEKLMHPDDKPLVDEIFRGALKKRQDSYKVEFRLLHKQGKYVPVLSRGFITFDKTKKPIRVSGTNMDLSEQKKAEQALKESEQMLQIANATKDKFFSIIAHDLRSPLITIESFSELLIEDVKEKDGTEYEKFLTLLHSSAKSAVYLLDNLLNWAKSQTEQIIFNPEYLNWSAVIQKVLEGSKAIAKLKSISINFIQSDEMEIYADKDMLMTILRNLISNSIKFTHSEGRIDIFTVRHQEFIEITISDNGVGMNEGTRNELFKLGANTRTYGTENERGSGLGLVLCKEFVEKHGGQIWVESEKGKGSDFKFTLPLNKSE